MSTNTRRRLFGTDGIRGRANEHPMTPELALQLGRAVAHVFRRNGNRGRIVIGKDTRLSNYMYEAALQAGICSMGLDAVQLGVLPTPGIAFMTTGMRADAGVVISASHNPFTDNGIKFFASDGFKLPDRVEAEIERLIGSGELDQYRAHGSDIGSAYRVRDAPGRYCVYLKSTLPRDITLSGLRIVVDCGNGAAYQVAPEVLHELGADVISLGTEPDGKNINDGCGALHPERVGRAVLEHNADLGIALDGDADRVILADDRGEIVDGDAMLAILADHMSGSGSLAHNTVVATVMTNLGLERFLADRDITLERSSVGDRYVVGRMRAGGFNLGGEQSGHLVLLNHTTTGDGLLTALQVLVVMLQREKRLSELGSMLTRVPQVLRSLQVNEKPPLDSLPSVADAIGDAESTLEGRGRVLVRYSGTEQKCRVMVEGDSEAEIHGLADGLANVIHNAIGVTAEAS